MQVPTGPANDAVTEERIRVQGAGGVGAIVFDAARLPQAGPELFSPSGLGERARPVAEGGRGAAWFVELDGIDGVLRHYRRGGMAARVSRERYLWRGEARTRSIAEFRLLDWLRRQGMPVPPPLAAMYQRRGLTYTAALIVERIPGARSLAQRLPDGEGPPPWTRIGATIARMHRLGVDHADLNAHNILLDREDRVWLIDFDRGSRDGSSGFGERNLRRLQRSLRKLAPDSPGVEVGFASLREGYLAAIGREA
ncbi:3-deoxy-D-manno-octulosonic acid kinase [Alcalisalibacterium limoincola]|uniref:3-deoxy-D-manno-octulosonic acid kinase n=1 Tax=Alkalisalibacterium limincola TaxID=2699169 RepID=A0A5C8L0F0_9GAMM|nr:3-deoxy-D-manno-octulosonic acid kinase [Alkalisalibacterium limincola]